MYFVFFLIIYKLLLKLLILIILQNRFKNKVSYVGIWENDQVKSSIWK